MVDPVTRADSRGRRPHLAPTGAHADAPAARTMRRFVAGVARRGVGRHRRPPHPRKAPAFRFWRR